MKDKKKITKLIIILTVILIIGGYLIMMTGLNRKVIGKNIHLCFKGEEGNATYLEKLLNEKEKRIENQDPNEKIQLLDKKAIEKLISYMKEEGLRIVAGEYIIPQTSDYEEIISILMFEADN